MRPLNGRAPLDLMKILRARAAEYLQGTRAQVNDPVEADMTDCLLPAARRKRVGGCNICDAHLLPERH